jgi:uncharacterized repeat protein (TIGR03803 family)
VSSRFCSILYFTLLFVLTFPQIARTQTFTTLASFDISNGRLPATPLVQGVDGNFYGTTAQGGVNGDGVVFKITKSGVLTDLYDFCSQNHCPDGIQPDAALVVGANGNLYGTTAAGGAYCPGDGALGCGTVFEITVGGKLTTLYKFCAGRKTCTDGAFPYAPLLLASDGNFYGTTYQGGAYGFGTVFRITPSGKLTTLYSFCSETNCPDGAYPETGLVEDGGKFYGTTYDGGTVSCPFFHNDFGCGTIFAITSKGHLTTLYSFATNAGLLQAPLALAINRKFYVSGGTGKCTYGCGTVFETTNSGSFTTLYSFCTKGTSYCPDGAYPLATLAQANDRNLYGTTTTGGKGAGEGGTIFRVTPQGKVKTVFNFAASNGYSSEGGLVQATDGSFYGTTDGGGLYNQGTVFQFGLGLQPLICPVPGAGAAGAGVLILGNDLNGTTRVSFNGKSAKFSVVSNTELKAIIPKGASSGKIEVTTASGKLETTLKFQIVP